MPAKLGRAADQLIASPLFYSGLFLPFLFIFIKLAVSKKKSELNEFCEKYIPIFSASEVVLFLAVTLSIAIPGYLTLINRYVGNSIPLQKKIKITKVGSHNDFKQYTFKVSDSFVKLGFLIDKRCEKQFSVGDRLEFQLKTGSLGLYFHDKYEISCTHAKALDE